MVTLQPGYKMRIKEMSSDRGLEQKKLDDSLKALGDVRETLASISSTLSSLNMNDVEKVFKDISSSKNDSNKSVISLPQDKHRELQKSIEKICLVRPTFIQYQSAINKIASYDAELIYQKISEQISQTELILGRLEDKRKSLEKVVQPHIEHS